MKPVPRLSDVEWSAQNYVLRELEHGPRTIEDVAHTAGIPAARVRRTFRYLRSARLISKAGMSDPNRYGSRRHLWKINRVGLNHLIMLRADPALELGSKVGDLTRYKA